MTPGSRLAAALALGLVSIPALAGQPQGPVVFDNGSVTLFDTEGHPLIVIDNGADYTAGGHGFTAKMILRSLDDALTFNYFPELFGLVLGDDGHEGVLLLKDDDGVTTTIDLDGRTGAIRLGGNNSHSTIPQTPATIQTWDSPISTSTVSVYVSRFTATTPEAVDRAFTLLIH